MNGTLIAATPHFIEQRWTEYTTENHRIWQMLFNRRTRELRGVAPQEFFDGLELLGLAEGEVPEFERVNARLQKLTGWQVVAVDGFLESHVFFDCLAQRRFPSTVTLRTLKQLEYLPEPDIFHDIFGHVPLLACTAYADYVHRFGQKAAQSSTPEELERSARIFWFTVEFGLMGGQDKPQVYGSGLISSAADAAHALSEKCDRRPFSMDAILRQEFRTDEIQKVLFVIDSFEDLFGIDL